MKKEKGYLFIFTLLGLVCGFSLAILVQQPDHFVQASDSIPSDAEGTENNPGILQVADQPEAATAATDSNRSFTYQGVLRVDGQPVNSECNFAFSLWDALTGGSQFGITQIFTSTVSNGQFTFTPNYSGNTINSTFDGRANWIGISVRCPAGSGTYTDITPRQAVRAAPLASGLVPHTEIRAGNSYSGNPLLKLTALATTYGNPSGLWAITDEPPAINATWKKVGVWADSVNGIGVRGTTGTGVALQGDAKNPLGHAGVFSGTVEINGNEIITGTVEINGNEIITGTVDIRGKLTSNMDSWQLINAYGPLPKTSTSFTTEGGTLLVFFSGSGFTNNAGGGYIEMVVKIDGVTYGRTGIFANNPSVHMALVPKQLMLTSISAGTHTLSLESSTSYPINTDGWDVFQVTVLEMPY